MTERRLRAMQLAIAAAGFAGVIAELVLHEHWAEPWQVAATHRHPAFENRRGVD